MTTAGTPIEAQRARVIRALTALSLTHSIVYLSLLTVWLSNGPDQLNFILGLSHGIGWILMSMVSVTCAARRWIPVRTAVGVAIIGGIGPFIGTYEFMRLRHEGAYTRST